MQFRIFQPALVGASVLALTMTSACSMKPEFPQSGPVGFGCYTEGGSHDFVVEFDRDTAAVNLGGTVHRLKFVKSILPRSEDRYEGDGYVLTLDPEAFLQSPDGSQRGPCTP